MTQQLYQHKSKDGRLFVYEGWTAFYIVNLATREERCMGDGVDMYTAEKPVRRVDNDFENFLDVGTPDFYAALTNDIDANTDELLEAYFGQA